MGLFNPKPTKKNNLWSLIRPGSFKESGHGEWFSATVPGVVHLDLLNNQQIPPPFHGNNETDLLWIEEKDWEYRCVFEQTKDQLARSHVQLVFEGLDTYATVYLNGQKILTHTSRKRYSLTVPGWVHAAGTYDIA